jgi:hypothetical protein
MNLLSPGMNLLFPGMNHLFPGMSSPNFPFSHYSQLSRSTRRQLVFYVKKQYMMIDLHSKNTLYMYIKQQ